MCELYNVSRCFNNLNNVTDRNVSAAFRDSVVELSEHYDINLDLGVDQFRRQGFKVYIHMESHLALDVQDPVLGARIRKDNFYHHFLIALFVAKNWGQELINGK